MPKLIAVFSLAILMVTFSGCGGVSESDHQTVVSEVEDLKVKVTKIEENLASLGEKYAFLKQENHYLANELVEQQREISRLAAVGKGERIEPEKSKSEKTPLTYKVESGDTLWSISRKFQVPAATIQKLNSLRGSRIRAGQVIRLDKPEQ